MNLKDFNEISGIIDTTDFNLVFNSLAIQSIFDIYENLSTKPLNDSDKDTLDSTLLNEIKRNYRIDFLLQKIMTLKESDFLKLYLWGLKDLNQHIFKNIEPYTKESKLLESDILCLISFLNVDFEKRRFIPNNRINLMKKHFMQHLIKLYNIIRNILNSKVLEIQLTSKSGVKNYILSKNYGLGKRYFYNNSNHAYDFIPQLEHFNLVELNSIKNYLERGPKKDRTGIGKKNSWDKFGERNVPFRIYEQSKKVNFTGKRKIFFLVRNGADKIRVDDLIRVNTPDELDFVEYKAA